MAAIEDHTYSEQEILNRVFNESANTLSTGTGGSASPGGDVSSNVKRALANVAASQTDSSLVAAVANKRIRVLFVLAVAGTTATNLTFNRWYRL